MPWGMHVIRNALLASGSSVASEVARCDALLFLLSSGCATRLCKRQLLALAPVPGRPGAMQDFKVLTEALPPPSRHAAIRPQSSCRVAYLPAPSRVCPGFISPFTTVKAPPCSLAFCSLTWAVLLTANELAAFCTPGGVRKTH